MPKIHNLKTRVWCEHPGCTKKPSQNFIDDIDSDGRVRPRYCAEHMKYGMINVRERRCLVGMCMTIPVFNYEGEAQGVYCDEHRRKGMINVTKKRCEHVGCTRGATHKIPGDRNSGRFCSLHKTRSMEYVRIKGARQKQCCIDGCDFPSKYNMPGENSPLYCALHSKCGMIKIKNKGGGASSDKLRALYNLAGVVKGRYLIKRYKCMNHDRIHTPYLRPKFGT